MTCVTFSYKHLTVQSHDSFWVDKFHCYYAEMDNSKKRRDDFLFNVKLDSFWVDKFHCYYAEADNSKKRRDDFLFNIKLDSKQIRCVKMHGIMCNNVWCMHKMYTIMYANVRYV